MAEIPKRVAFQTFPDDRGDLSPLQLSEFFPTPTQMNFVKTKPGVIRGLHFQFPPWEQRKLVYCMSGVIFDVAVDLLTDKLYSGQIARVKQQEG